MQTLTNPPTRLALHVAFAILCAPAIGAPPPAPGEEDAARSREWLESMVAVHGYTLAEVAEATGLDENAAKQLLQSHELAPGTGRASPEPRDAAGNLRVVPYPGGRHPRIGFLEGAIDPWRESKLSVLLPWRGAGYAVVDLPEAVWESGKLWFLAHKHIPTVWDEQNVKLGRRDWERLASGGWQNRFWLPDGAALIAEVRGGKDAVEMTLRLRNDTSRRLGGLRTQICVMLKGAPAMNAQTNDNKTLEPRDGPPSVRYGAVQAAGAERWLVTLWSRAQPWANEKCPCLHADPVFPDLEPGEEATLHGRIFFHEGPGLAQAVERHRRELQGRDSSPHRADARLLSARKIWDRGNHNAFTDLVRHEGRWLCTFREGAGHVSPDGALRVLSSPDGLVWRPAALLTSPTADLRDPKICHLPSGALHLSGAAALHQPSPVRHQTLAWTSTDGHEWSGPTEIGDPNRWLWRVDWIPGIGGFSAGYATAGNETSIRLYRTDDGVRFRTTVPTLSDAGYVNETSFAPLGDDRVVCVVRRDRNPGTALLGQASAPYTEWTWRDLGTRIGGPKLLRLPDGRYVVGCRLYDGGARTALCRVDVEKARLEEIVRLPSGGDTSYPGLVWHDGLLWMSYYSSHEGRTSIWLARIEI